MSLGLAENTFSGGGLDRRSETRRDAAWAAARWAEPGARAVLLRAGDPLMEGERLALRPTGGGPLPTSGPGALVPGFRCGRCGVRA
jgi:hypothetical protein